MTSPFTVCLLGTGKIGEAICALLSLSGRYKVRACDIDFARAKHVAALFPKHCEAHELKLEDTAKTKALLNGCNAVISALPFFCNPRVAELAVECGVHYLDLTEDVEVTKKVGSLAKKGGPCLIPQCGLAPGFISIAAHQLIQAFEKVESVKMRVGALPLFPSNKLKYNLTWSTEGLINEYGNPCEVIDGGEKRIAVALEGYERFSLDGDEYEAFNTSGGLGTLADTMKGKLQKLDYKSIRYPGHCELISFLMHDLGFNQDRESLKKIFERSIPNTTQDKCIILVEVQGQSKGRLVQKTYASSVYSSEVSGRHYGAIQVTTASGICTPLDMLLTGKFGTDRSGWIRCEEISLIDFLDNEFGKYYRDEKALSGVKH